MNKRFVLISVGIVLLLPVTNDNMAGAENTTTSTSSTTSLSGKTCPYRMCVYKLRRTQSILGRRSYTTAKTCRLESQTCPKDKKDCCSSETGCCSFEEMKPYVIATGVITGLIALSCLAACGIYYYKRKKKRSKAMRNDAVTVIYNPAGYPRQTTSPMGYPAPAPGGPGYPTTPPPGYQAPAPGYPTAPAIDYPTTPAPGYPAPDSNYPTTPAPGYPPPAPGYPPPAPGYPPPAQGYLASTQGYPMSSPGYPAPTSQVSIAWGAGIARWLKRRTRD